MSLKSVNKATKIKYLEDLDVVLATLGFRRRRNHQEWKHRVDSANELWIHINFGLSVVNPSIGVKYLDLVELLPKKSGAVIGTMRMLSSLLKPPRLYTIEETSSPVACDLYDKGMPMFSHLLNREFVIEALKSNVVSDWHVVSYSDRIRLLPLLLANNGRLCEAFHLLEQFQSESLGRDQILPGYEVFAKTFGKRFAI
jgi:hypothetical protein